EVFKPLAFNSASSDTPWELAIEAKVSPDCTVYAPVELVEAVLLELDEAAGAGASSIAALAGAMPINEALAAVARVATLMENFLVRRERRASSSACSDSMRARRVVKVMLLLSVRR